MKSMEFEIVGLKHRVTPSTLRQIQRHIDEEGSLLVGLEREPKNVHDENAIKVVIADPPWKGLHVGFIRRTTAEVMAPRIDSGAMLDLRGFMLNIDIEDGTAEAVMEWNPAAKKAKSKK